ncbi:hypothetical protein NC661_17000 [Aquibacillus koreensis]|uniref:Uncharacterized protein n=1 Tax=Aquibacillus koreensis TaxID=279446 RepID=A0A9X3WRK8_9BACI|nr:hypothetical protein [Aquibacillus koreensis]MCT2536134.1 hypothetical protein [Aquibacillus koreensis]MDC3422059.1 hypothetical protein [Aquibacillus koreensis]
MKIRRLEKDNAEVIEMEKNKKEQTEKNSAEGMGVRNDMSTENPTGMIDRYAGDSVNEHKNLETANAYLAEEEIKQQRDNL